MGGHALSQVSVRLSAARYRAVCAQVLAQLRLALPQRRLEAIMAYASKANFGDLDILLELNPSNAADDEPAALCAVLQATEMCRNGSVTSYGVTVDEGMFQVDLIQTPSSSFDFAARYFSFNDLGNLIGRIAYQFAAKFGHAGLYYPLFDPQNPTHMLADVLITEDFSQALRLLGYAPQRYEDLRQHGGFQTLEDIFQFAISTPYASAQVYLLENRNHVSRIRDAKRPTYNAFLAWLRQLPPAKVPNFTWGASGSELRQAQKQAFLTAAFQACPAFQKRYSQVFENAARKAALKARHNGALAAEVTGLSGQVLGKLMQAVRRSFADETQMEAFFLHATQEQIHALYLQHAQAIRMLQDQA